MTMVRGWRGAATELLTLALSAGAVTAAKEQAEDERAEGRVWRVLPRGHLRLCRQLCLCRLPRRTLSVNSVTWLPRLLPMLLLLLLLLRRLAVGRRSQGLPPWRRV